MSAYIFTIPLVLIEAAREGKITALLASVHPHYRAGDKIELIEPGHLKQGVGYHDTRSLGLFLIQDVGLIQFYFYKTYEDSFCKYKGKVVFPSQYHLLTKQLGYIQPATFQRREFYLSKHHYKYLQIERLS